MTNPVITAVAAGGWVKVATNVTCVGAMPLKQLPYMYTYRDTGDPAPTLTTEGAKLPAVGRSFSSPTAFDLYIWCTDAGGTAGSIRVDVGFQAEYLIDA